eukprot:1868859-Rhodomonas_salina.4
MHPLRDVRFWAEDQAGNCLSTRYVVSGTNLAYGATSSPSSRLATTTPRGGMHPRARYAKSGTEIAYGRPRKERKRT